MELDRRTIKLLASDTRSNIIKSLAGRRKTMSELSRELGLAPATVSEQLSTLEKGKLVKKIDSGHKWKYYELTKKAKAISRPQFPVFLVIASLVVVLFAGVFFIGGNMAAPAGSQARGLGAAPEGTAPNGLSAAPSVFVACSDGNVVVKNPMKENITVVLRVGNGTMEREVPAGGELNESNVTNGTVYSEAGAVSYSC